MFAAIRRTSLRVSSFGRWLTASHPEWGVRSWKFTRTGGSAEQKGRDERVIRQWRIGS